MASALGRRCHFPHITLLNTCFTLLLRVLGVSFRAVRPNPIVFALALAACAHTPQEVPMHVEAPWLLTVADGSANFYRFECAEPGGPVRFEYKPVTPETSSTGFYSGGPPRSETLDQRDARLSELWRLLKELEADTAQHTPERAKGTGAITWATPSGKHEFILKMGARLSGLLEVLKRFGG